MCADSVLTGLLFLTDGFEGGQTQFPLLNLTIIPERGALLFFHNVRHQACKDDARATCIEGDPLTLHRGKQVVRGHKLLCSILVTESPFES